MNKYEIIYANNDVETVEAAGLMISEGGTVRFYKRSVDTEPIKIISAHHYIKVTRL